MIWEERDAYPVVINPIMKIGPLGTGPLGTGGCGGGLDMGRARWGWT